MENKKNEQEVVKLKPHYFPKGHKKALFHDWPIWPLKKVFYPPQGSPSLHQDEDNK